MRRDVSFAMVAILVPLLIGLGGRSSFAQLPRKPLVATAQQATPADGPSFRDPKTGQVWTPGNVGQDTKPTVNPEDRAFDPSGQVVAVGAQTEQNAQVEHVGTVPIRAGAAVPLVEIDSASLQVNPGGHWRVVLDLQNNAASTLVPVLGCQFLNGEKPVLNTRVLVAPTPGGERLGLSFQGPASELFVDRVTCRIESP
jgi:hypothetical protein